MKRSRVESPVALMALGLVLTAPGACGELAGEGPPPAERRAAMIREIEADVRATRRETGRAELDRRVIDALAKVPRHEFVPDTLRERAYENRPLPIGHAQTISQPFVVALMTDLLALGDGAVVLDVGTGSGYQAAVLAEVAAKVYSIEIIPELGEEARRRLRELGYDNVEVRIGDGYYGWPEAAPFDGILVAAAIDEVPGPLVDQLKTGGRIVLPQGNPSRSQDLVVLEKTESGRLDRRSVIPVRFVPLTGEH